MPPPPQAATDTSDIRFFSTPLESVPGQKTIRIRNTGGGRLPTPTVSVNYTTSTGWLTAQANPVTGEDAFDISLTGTETGLSVGPYQAQVTADFGQAGTIILPVLMRVLGGFQWEYQALTGNSYYAAAPLGSSDFVAVGELGTVVTRKAGVYSIIPCPTQANLRAVAAWGNDIVVGGTDGVILHYDGTMWTAYPPCTDATVMDIWGLGPDDFWIGCLLGDTQHWDGSSWTEYSSNTIIDLEGTSNSNLYGVRSIAIRHFDGTQWQYLPPLPDSPVHNLQSMSVLSDGKLVVIDSTGFFFYDGTQWLQPTGTNPVASGCITGTGKARYIDSSTIEVVWGNSMPHSTLYDTHGDWSSISYISDTTRSDVDGWRFATLLSDGSSVVVGGGGGIGVFNGTDWFMEQQGYSGATIAYLDCAGTWEGRLYASGGWGSPYSSEIRSWTSASGWKKETNLTDYPDRAAVFPDGIAFSGDQVFYTYNGTSWIQGLDAPATRLGGASGESVTHCYVCGSNGTIYHRGLTGWHILYSTSGLGWFESCRIGTITYFAGENGRVAKYEGGKMTMLESPTTYPLLRSVSLPGITYFYSNFTCVSMKEDECTLESLPATGGIRYMFTLDGDVYLVDVLAFNFYHNDFYLWVKDADHWRQVCRLPDCTAIVQFESDGRQMLMDQYARMFSLVR